MNEGFDKEYGGEQGLIPLEESLKIAKELIARHGEEVARESYEHDPYGRGISPFIRSIPKEVLEHYTGHGVVRGDIERQLAATLNILTNRIIKGWSGPLAGNSYEAWSRGNFLFVSHYDERLLSPSRETGHAEANIGAVILGPAAYPLLEDLRAMFPELSFFRADECGEYLRRP